MPSNIFEFRNPNGDDEQQLTLPPNLVRNLLIAAIVIAILALLSTSAYTVAPYEEAVVLRLGHLHGTPQQAGFHFKLPLPIDRVYKVPTKKVHKEEFGYRTESAGVRSKFRVDAALTQAEALMLAGDLNMATVEWVVQYRISDPVAYLFNIREPVQTLRDVSESIMRRVVGDRSVDRVLTVGRVEIENEVTAGMQATMDAYGAGISIDQVKLKNVKPPEPVQASFNDVNKATQDRQRFENEALAAYNEALPKAEGKALQQLEAARGYAIERTNEAKGDAARFKRVYEEYKKAPDVTRRRLYLEAMAKVLPGVQEVVVLDEAGRGVLPLLDIAGKGRVR